MKSEETVQAEIRAEAGRRGILLWRNNSGAMQDETGRVVRYGLGNDSAQLNRRLKSADLIGLVDERDLLLGAYPTSGRFLAVECKEESWTFPNSWRRKTPDVVAGSLLGNNESTQRTLAQWRFLTLVHNAGGLAGFATCVEHFDRILNRELVLP